MAVLEYQRIEIPVFCPLDPPPDDFCIVFVKDLIGLKIKAPVVGAAVEREIGLFRKNDSGLSLLGIIEGPNRLEENHFSRALFFCELSANLERLVVALAHIEDEFVHHGQKRPQGFEKGIIEADPVTNEAESRYFFHDFHKPCRSRGTPARK
ncbi:MAG: hypothetical protein EBX52_10390 [Proteobacteria bacterium]|nr:hypothetical protein [Pseudomonadota bacterium]